MCNQLGAHVSRDPRPSREAGPKTPAPRTPGAPVPNFNYRRDLARSLDAVGRRITSGGSLECALARHPDVRPRCTAWLGNARGFVDSAQRWAMPPQPVTSGAVIGACLGNQPPVRRRMVHPAEVHQFVDQDVVADPCRHQHQSPVQADVAVTSAGTPPRSLITNTDAADGKPMACRQFEQPRREFTPRLLSQCVVVFNRTEFVTCTCSLSRYPIDVSLDERLGLTT